jgi:hypothetical protein
VSTSSSSWTCACSTARFIGVPHMRPMSVARPRSTGSAWREAADLVCDRASEARPTVLEGGIAGLVGVRVDVPPAVHPHPRSLRFVRQPQPEPAFAPTATGTPYAPRCDGDGVGDGECCGRWKGTGRGCRCREWTCWNIEASEITSATTSSIYARNPVSQRILDVVFNAKFMDQRSIDLPMI